MEDPTAIGRSLPLFALLPALGLSLIMMLFVARRAQSGAAQFVLWALYLRFVASALHDITFKPSPLGVSWNALISIAIFGIGLLFVRRRTIFDVAIVPFIPLVLVLIAAGAANGAYPTLATALTKYGYLIVLIMAAQDAFAKGDEASTLRLFLWPFVLPFGLQLISIVLNVPKPGESDGADSFIGGYNHEAAFSLVLISALLIVCLAREMRLSFRLFLTFYLFAAVVLANYRTSILAILPLVAIAIVGAIPRRFVAAQRTLVTGMMVLVGVGVFTAGALLSETRYADLGVVSQEKTEIIKRPEMFSDADRKVLSGRAMIWSEYIYGWVDAPPERKLIGFGPETWTGYFTLYAHNTLVNALFETGILGVLATLFMWSWMLALALMLRVGPKLEIVAAHLSFFLLNMATMPMWQLEGMIFYGILCGYTIYWFGRSRAAARGWGVAPEAFAV